MRNGWKMILMMLFVTIVSTASGQRDKLPKADSLFNPFSYSIADPNENLFVVSLYYNLENELAIEVIRNAFEREGVHLEENAAFRSEGVMGILDGYNATEKMGFVWMQADRFERSSKVMDWNRDWNWYLEANDETDTLRAKIIRLARYDRGVDSVYATAMLLDSMPDSPEVRARMAQLVETFENHIRREDAEVYTYSEISKLEALAKEGIEFIAVIGPQEQRYLHQSGIRTFILLDKEMPKVGSPEYEAREAEFRKPMNEALYRLQSDVRQFAKWARQQRGL